MPVMGNVNGEAIMEASRLVDVDDLERRLKKAEEAARYMLERVTRDVNFAWYMFGSQAMELCYEVESGRSGKTREKIEAVVIAARERDARETGRDKPDVKVAEEKLDAIRLKMSGRYRDIEPGQNEWAELYDAICELVS